MLATGTEIGGYRVEGLLGRGGMGVVYEATQLSLNRRVALKLLAAELSDDPGFSARFRREGRIQAGIDHGHIVTIYEAGESEEGLFIAMRIVRGPNLKQLVRNAEVDPARAVRILTPVADALDTAHESGLIHRDVKPQNILVGRRDHAYLADFGLTKALGDSGGMTRTGQLMGTIDYIAPEQIRGEPASPASDVYALAAVAWECFTGVPPFHRPSDAATMFAHMSDPPPSVLERRPELPAAVDGWLSRGLAKDPADRPETAFEMLTGLGEALEGWLPRTNGASPVAEPDEDEGTPTDLVSRPVRGVPVAPPPPEPPEPEPQNDEPNAVTPAPADVLGVSPGGTELIAPAGTPTRDDLRRDWAPPAAEAPAEPPVKRAGRWGAAIAAAAVAVAALAGLLVGHGARGTPPAPPHTVQARQVAFTAPGDWHRVAPPTVPGLAIAHAVAVAKPTARRDAVIAGTADGTGARLLPVAFERRLPDTPQGDPVRLGRVQAYHYADLAPRGQSSKLELYVTPLRRGVAVVACLGTAAGDTCDRAAGSLRLRGGASARQLGPSAAYAKALRAAIDRLAKSRARALKALSAAKTSVAQAPRAAAVATAYDRAANAVAKIDPGPLEARAQPALHRALTRARDAYRRLAAAARTRNRARYAQARKAAASADSAARAAVGALHDLGYDVG